MKKLLSIFCVLLLTLGVFFSSIPVSYAETTSHVANSNDLYNDSQHVGEDVCTEPAVKRTLRLLGVFLMILRFAVPIIIIAKGTFLFYNAVVKDGSDQLGKSAKEFGGKLILGIFIFFIPTLIETVLNLYVGFTDVKPDYVNCSTCLLDPVNCE